jgi:hypothetical protein
VASTKRTARSARKKYVPSAKQRAEDERLKQTLDCLTRDDFRQFDKALDQLFDSEIDQEEARKRWDRR